jgi:radical SAM/Cys-rich protein
VLLEPGVQTVPEWFREHGIHLVASMPCYLEENVRAQRGGGVYEKSIEALRKLNALGYGIDPDLPLNLVYNPGGPFLPPDQAELEADYRRELEGRHGVVFSHLLTITNIPIGRFLTELRWRDQEGEYLRLLRDAFNPTTVEGLMCRKQISVGWDGTLFDCDFNLALGYAVDHGAPDHLRTFDLSALVNRRIVTGDHCFGCTAGHGSSCGGALA